MRFLKYLMITVAVLILAFVLIGMVLSREYKIARSVTIQADVAKVHELVGDLKRWPEWSPWEKHDPTVKTTFGEATTGVGASQSWTSAEQGGGWLKFTKCDPQTGIAYDMAFTDGNGEIPARSWMTYAPASGGVQVEWGMEGSWDMPLIGGYMAAMADTMIGPMFQEGLDDLKKKAEAK